jgi:O-antigen/teichoic acid export membrane protein
VELWLIFAGTIATALMEAGYGFLLGCGRMRANALVAATAPWLYAALLGAAALQAGLTVTRAAAVWAVAHGTWAAALLVASARGIGLGRPSLALLRESLSLGLRIWLGSLARILNFRVDQILMGFIASETALGIYAVAVNGSEVLLYLPTVAASVLLPALARSPRAARPEQTLRMFRMLALLTGIAVALAAALGPLLIPEIFGADYRGSVLPFLWLLPGAFGFAASAVFSNALIAASAPGRSSIGPLVSLVVGLALDIALIPSYGASGAAVAASIAFLAGGAAALIVYRRATLFPWRQIMPGLADLAEARLLAAGMLSRARRSTET